MAGLRMTVLLALAGVIVLAISAQISLPLPYVPMTLQTLAVLLIGASYSRVLGTATVLLYLVAGACGLPVFAGLSGGTKTLFGATAGFLAGFAVAAFFTGWLAERGWDRSLLRRFALMLLGHVIILAMGWAWLAYGVKLGPARALAVGITPFLAGAVVKSVIGAILLPLVNRATGCRNN